MCINPGFRNFLFTICFLLLQLFLGPLAAKNASIEAFLHRSYEAKIYLQLLLKDKKFLAYFSHKLNTIPDEAFISNEDGYPQLTEIGMRSRDIIISTELLKNKTAQELGNLFGLLGRYFSQTRLKALASLLNDSMEKIHAAITYELVRDCSGKNDLKKLESFISELEQKTLLQQLAYKDFLLNFGEKLKFDFIQELKNGEKNWKKKSVANRLQKMGKTLHHQMTKGLESRMKQEFKEKSPEDSLKWLLNLLPLQSPVFRPRGESERKLIDVNTAALSELADVPLLGEEIARQIITLRKKLGGFNSINELTFVKGIGPFVLERLRELLKVELQVKEEREWTFLFYINGDNDLETFQLRALDKLELFGSGRNCHIVVQFDRVGNDLMAEHGKSQLDAIADGNWHDTRRYYIKKDKQLLYLASEKLQSLGEVDMGKPETLKDFLAFGSRYFPSKKVALIIVTHGGGIDGISYDDKSSSHLKTAELAKVLKSFKRSRGKAIDFLGFHACLMGCVELVNELNGAVKSVFFSEGVEYLQPFYDSFFTGFFKLQKRDYRNAAHLFLSSYLRYMEKWTRFNQELPVTAVAVDLSREEKLSTNLKKVLNRLADQPEVVDNLAPQLGAVNNYYSGVDLVHFLKLVSLQPDWNSDELLQKIRKGLEPKFKLTSFGKFNLKSSQNSNSFVISTGSGLTAYSANGLSLFFPHRGLFSKVAEEEDDDSLEDTLLDHNAGMFEKVKDLSFYRDSTWYEYLSRELE
ncbi:clostripain-related cysteine peptidase [Candidatus Riflebacteria bacterium]